MRSPLILLVAVGGIAAATIGVRDAGAQPMEAAVKAAFLPKFAPYATWPSAAVPLAGSPYVLCVVGQDPFGALLDEAVVGQRRDVSPISIRRLARVDAQSGCHIAYLGGSPAQPVAAGLAAVAGAPVLTVTDARVGRDRGMVHFELRSGRVRFHIDDSAAARASLALSSKLLSLALSVRQRGHP
ncbi:MAG: YfiR family protein [Sphingomonadaceae bacterium]|nr:YfiR family protein [Sphingomonadaceae bacterium]